MSKHDTKRNTRHLRNDLRECPISKYALKKLTTELEIQSIEHDSNYNEITGLKFWELNS